MFASIVLRTSLILPYAPIMSFCLAAGNSVGGWWAARISLKGGEKAVRYVMVVAIFIIALKLLGII